MVYSMCSWKNVPLENVLLEVGSRSNTIRANPVSTTSFQVILFFRMLIRLFCKYIVAHIISHHIVPDQRHQSGQ